MAMGTVDESSQYDNSGSEIDCLMKAYIIDRTHRAPSHTISHRSSQHT